ncbi:MAG: radical SAM protein, partial [Pseudomonadota bacterium]
GVEIATSQPEPLPVDSERGFEPALARARTVMQRLGLNDRSQQMGTRWPIGCVAVEITQRCNLDCTLCYLSEYSEAVHDLPLAEVYRRLDAVVAHYGAGTDVQITGGDPTLRKRSELIDIVRYAANLGLRPTLMTNGIKASADLLKELAEAGLMDVAFHVDTTQMRRGFVTEADLNVLRDKYLDRVRGTGLSVMFNTTVHADNFDDVPMLVRFFRQRADQVRTVAFQLQADTGRGVWRERARHITLESMSDKVAEGAGAPVDFSVSKIGHPDCSRYALSWVVGQRLFDLFHDRALTQRLQGLTSTLRFHRNRPRAMVYDALYWLVTDPRRWSVVPLGTVWVVRNLWRARGSLFRTSAMRPTTLSFTLHNFMSADRLVRSRIGSCVFKTMTANGPIAMCLHNAKRDEFILAPVGEASSTWDPLTGRDTARAAQAPSTVVPTVDLLPKKRLKGRAKARRLSA